MINQIFKRCVTAVISGKEIRTLPISLLAFRAKHGIAAASSSDRIPGPASFPISGSASNLC